MEQLDIEHVKKVLGDHRCNKNLKCARGGLAELCKAREIGSDLFMVCLEEDPNCSFTISFGHGFMCKCPVRVYLSKEFKI